MGQRVAYPLLSRNVLCFIELSEEYSLEEIKILISMAGKSLSELDIRAEFHVSVIAIMSKGDIMISPSPDQVMGEEDVLVVIGTKQDLADFANIK